MPVVAKALFAFLFSLPLSSLASAVLELPPVNAPSELAKRASLEKDIMFEPLRYAVPVDLTVSPKTHGVWTDVPGGREWQLRLRSEGATDLSLGFGEFDLPAGATLFLEVDTGKNNVSYGPYSAKDATEGQFWSAPLPGGEALVRLLMPADVTESPNLMLTRVGTGFRDLYKLDGGPGFSKQGACNNDVVCSVADGWRDEIRSVAAYTVGGIDTCTGTLVMDTAQTFRPYFLTAWHCDVREENAPSVVTIWNFESPTCGQLGGGSRLETVSGSTFLAGREDTDSALLELSSAPPASFEAYYAGWDRTDDTPTGSVGIHHPRVDEKAISFNTDALTKTNNCIVFGSSASTHWEVDNWEDGTTEPGSSGSALFEPDNKRVIGFLSGGSASCTSITEDCYGRMGIAWAGGSDETERLSPWLDQFELGDTVVDGSNPPPFTLSAEPAEVSVCQGSDAAIDITVGSIDGFSGAVTLATENLPTGLSAAVGANPVVAPGSSTLTLTDTASVDAGTYKFLVRGTSGGDARALGIELDVASPGGTDAPTPVAPADGATNITVLPTLEWTGNNPSASYEVEVATDAAFANVVLSETVEGTSLSISTPLDAGTTYYWRARSTTGCGSSAYSSVRAFTTALEYCQVSGEAIPDNSALGLSLTQSIAGNQPISSVRVRLRATHTWVGDLIATVSHDDTGADAILMDRPGFPEAAQSGCSGNNVNAVFDDDAVVMVEDQCGADPAISGDVIPQEPLSEFIGVSLGGDWTITMTDNAALDTGRLDAWCLLPVLGSQPDILFSDGFE